MHIHNPGDEFWFFLEAFPTEMPTFYLPIKSDPNIKYIDVRIKDTVVISQNTAERKCSEGTQNESFVDCIKSGLIVNMEENGNLNCSTWISDVIKNWSLPECKTIQDFHNVSHLMSNMLYENLASLEKCNLPCKNLLYSAGLTFGKLNDCHV